MVSQGGSADSRAPLCIEMDDPIIPGEDEECRTPPNAKRAARRKMRDSLVSPSSMRAVKLSKVRDDIIFEKVKSMIKVELDLMRAAMERELVKARDAYKLQLYNELMLEMKNNMRAELDVAQTLWRKGLGVTITTFEAWKAEMEKCLNGKDALIEELKKEVAEHISKSKKDKDVQPAVIEELNSIKEQVKTLKEEEQQKTREAFSWADKLFQTQKKADEAEKWIVETAKKGKGGMSNTTPPSTIINLTLEEEQKRKTRALHVRVTGLKDTNNVEEEVNELLKQMSIPEPTHTGAWRVGRRGNDGTGSSKERVLSLSYLGG